MRKHFNLDKRWCRTVVGVSGLLILFLASCVLKVQSANHYQIAGAQSGNAVKQLADKLTSYDRHTIKYHYFRYENVEVLDEYIKTDNQSYSIAGCDVVLREYYYDGVNIKAKFEVSSQDGEKELLNQFGMYDFFMNRCSHAFVHKGETMLWQYDSGEYLGDAIVGDTKTIFYSAKLSTPIAMGKEGNPGALYAIAVANVPTSGEGWQQIQEYALAEYPLEITAERFVYKDEGLQIVVTPLGIEWMVHREKGQSYMKIASVAFYEDGRENVVIEGHDIVSDVLADVDWEEGSYNDRWHSRWAYTFRNIMDLSKIDYVEVTREDGSKVKLELE